MPPLQNKGGRRQSNSHEDLKDIPKVQQRLSFESLWLQDVLFQFSYTFFWDAKLYPYKSSCNSKSIEADKLKSELSKLTVKTEKRIIFQVQIGFNKYNVYFTNSYYRFDSNFIRFSLFILSTKGVKPYLCRIKSNFAPDMTQVKMKKKLILEELKL